MHDPAFIAHKSYLTDLEHAAKASRMSAGRTAMPRVGRGRARAIVLLAAIVVLGAFQPWMV